MSLVEYFRMVLVGAILMVACFYVTRERQDRSLNFALFYALLYTAVSVVFIHLLAVKLGWWYFKDADNCIQMPWDIYFIWVLVWSVVPVFLMRNNRFIVVLIFVAVLDFTLMPAMHQHGWLVLDDNWWIGEVLLLLFAFTPAYYWAYNSLHAGKVLHRTYFQIVVVGLLFFFLLPYVLYYNAKQTFFFDDLNTLEWQLLLVASIPGLQACMDLSRVGLGTPFPYDPTTRLVRSGVYAYCKNPIQLSFVLLYACLGLVFQSWWYGLAIVISWLYACTVSDFQEKMDMEHKFGFPWITYNQLVPNWFFLWRPTVHAPGTLYYDSNCGVCSQLKQWVVQQKPIELNFKPASEFAGCITQLTYIDPYGRAYKSVRALAKALNHTHLIWSFFGWVMFFPPINFLLQTIVDSIFERDLADATCEL